jgi:hypothetical protein
MRKLLSIFALAFVAFAIQATEFTVFDGASTSEDIPICSRFMDWSDYYHQTIYHETQIEALKGQAITSIKYYVANENGCTLSGGNVSLYIGITEKNDFNEYNVSLIPAEDLTLVAGMAMTTGVNEIEFVLDEPWTYEGGNIVIQTVIDADGSVVGSEATVFLGEVEAYASACGTWTPGSKDFAPKTTFTYEGGGEEPGLTLLSEANGLEDNTEFAFDGDAVVTVCKNGYVFLRDESGYGMIAGVDGTFENGQVLKHGWSATKTSVNGWVRYINAQGLIYSGQDNAALAAAQVLNTLPTEDMINAFVVIENTAISNASGGGLFPGVPSRVYTLPNGDTIQKTETLWGMDGDAGDAAFNVYGIICKVGNKLMLQPVAFEEYVEPQPEFELGDVNHSGGVDIDDVTMLINKVLGNSSEGFFPEQANCDCDENGTIDIDDVTALITRVLTGSW